MKRPLHLLPMAIVFLFGCSQTKTQLNPPLFSPDHSRYISAYTNGKIDKKEKILIRFATDIAPSTQTGKVTDKQYFEFDPEIKGASTWVDSRTLSFQPQEYLRSGTVYNARFKLSMLNDTIAKTDVFPFQFYTQKQTIYVVSESMQAASEGQMQWQKLQGTLSTLEYENGSEVKKILEAKVEGKSMKVDWIHSEEGTTHTFLIDSIERKGDPLKLQITWDGSVIGAEGKGELLLDIAALGDFKVVQANAFSNPEQYVQVLFSDPLQPGQDLSGMVTLNYSPVTYTIENNNIKIFPQNKVRGNVNLIIEPGIKNVMGHKIQQQQTIELHFDDVQPQIRAVGTGVIIPRTDAVPFPFETINLNAVDIQVVQIFEDNVLQFLQYNDIQESNSLEYVGRVVYESKVDLDTNKELNLNKWNRHGIDLSKLIDPQPGAIYRINIRYRKQYSLYECDADTLQRKNESDILFQPSNTKLWDYYRYYKFNGTEKNTPCEDYFYINAQGITSNVLASDMGITAKRGTDGSMLVAVTDLKTTQRLSDIQLEVYNFQKQIFKTLSTDGNGFATFESEEMPFVIMAKKGRQRGYLRLRNTPLSLSKFDVAGQNYHKGVKGFIYTERGVWRPGDSLFVNFLLEDKLKVLPANYPLVFELTDPRGQLVTRIMNNSGINGFYKFHTATDLNAPTGDYTAKINVGGVFFQQVLKVETVVPNRLKIAADFEGKEIYSTDKSLGNIEVKWLHGAPAGNIRSEITVSMSKPANVFPKFPEYSFTDPIKSISQDIITVFDEELDNEGKAEVKNTLSERNNLVGPMHADFFCKAFEPGGNFSTDRFQAVYHPYEKYVGIKPPKGDGNVGVLFTNQDHEIEVLTIDQKGNPIDTKVDLYLYKLSWRWWWDYYDDLSSYNGKFYNDPVATTIVKTTGGKGKWKIKIAEGDYGRYYFKAVIEAGHSTGKIVYFDYPGWYSRKPETPAGASMLTFSSNKTKYTPGETVVLDIPTGFDGAALVTIENGSKVLSKEWVSAAKGNIQYAFKATEEMAPNVYAYVSLIQPHAQTANDLPIRMYGVIPIAIDNPESHLQPRLLLPDEIRPEEKLNMVVSEASGKPMTYTIAMVDEGLLDLTRFKTPDPWTYFNAKEALLVKTWDLYDNVLGNQTSKIRKLLSIGGDEGSEEYVPSEGTKVQRFKPMVVFIGPYTLSSGSTATHTVTIPKYFGSVRTMVIAGDNGSYGSAEVTTPVRKPLMVAATLPRVLGPDEAVELPVNIFTMADHVKDVTIEVKTSPNLVLIGSSTQKVTFTKKGERLALFNLKVKAETGVAKVSVTARSGKEKASYDIELQVRAPNPYVSEAEQTNFLKDKVSTITYQAFGMKGTNRATLEVSAIPPVNLGDRLYYLIQYPHGCIEQTTSSVFPQLYLTNLFMMEKERQREIETNVKAGIRRLKNFQRMDGSMCYWPGDYSDYSDWGTNYAGHFLIEAKNVGYTLPEGMLQKWMDFQKKKVNMWSQNSETEFAQSYRLYLLALAQAPEFGAMNRLKGNAKLGLMAKWYLSAAYFISGQKGAANELSKALTIKVDNYRELGHTYGSTFRDQAMILETLSIMNKNEKVGTLVQDLSRVLSSDNWLSTQETAFGLMAIAKFAKLRGNEPFEFEYQINDQEWKKVSSKNPIYEIPVNINKVTKGSIKIKSISKPLFGCMITGGIAPPGKESTSSSKMNMEIRYKDMKGEDINIEELEQGTDFVAEITVENPSKDGEKLDELALHAMFPAGWQIYNSRMTGMQFEGKTSTPDYLDIRDDRAFYYFDLEPYDYYEREYNEEDENDESSEEESAYNSYGNKRIFRIALNASFNGKFYLPQIYCSAMYDNSVYAGVEGKWIKVVGKQRSVVTAKAK
jgi:uncharacterized protein YfaS (alpha-2-macroglobulin family)